MTKLQNGTGSAVDGAQAGRPWTEACEPLAFNGRVQERFCCGEELAPFLTPSGCHARICSHCKKVYFDNQQIHDAHSAWIGVDLDGTLAADTGRELWDAEGNPKIGRPIDEMVLRVKKWLAEGVTVKIFTARASFPSQVEAMRAWLARRGLPDLEITNRKDLNMVMLWDDRCVQVAPNSGRPLTPAITKTNDRRRLNRIALHAPAPNRAKTSVRLLYRLKMFLTL